MSPWLLLVVVGFGTMKIVQTVKEILPWVLRPWTLSLVSIATATALCAGFSNGPRWTLTIGLGAAGVAALVHEVRDVLSAQGDVSKSTVILRSTTGRQRVRM